MLIDRTVSRARPLFWGSTMGNFIHYGTLDGAILYLISMLLRLILNKRTLNRAILFFYLNAFVAHSKQWAGFFRAVRLFNMGSVLIEIKVVGNDIINNLYLHDKHPILYCSPSGSLQSWPNSQIWLFFKSDTVITNYRYPTLF